MVSAGVPQIMAFTHSFSIHFQIDGDHERTEIFPSERGDLPLVTEVATTKETACFGFLKKNSNVIRAVMMRTQKKLGHGPRI